MSCLLTMITGNVCQFALHIFPIQNVGINKHKTVTNITVFDKKHHVFPPVTFPNVLGWLVNSGAPTLMIRHQSLMPYL